MLSKERVLFIGDSSGWSFLAATQLRRVYGDVQTIFWDFGTPEPSRHLTWKGDRIFTFKADLILPPEVIGRATKSAINFHPSVPQFRGVGGYYYALADKCEDFGATCHHIDNEIDHGEIIAVDRFPIFDGEDVESLIDRTAHVCLGLFYRIIQQLSDLSDLPTAENERWGNKLYTRKALAKFIQRTQKEKLLGFA